MNDPAVQGFNTVADLDGVAALAPDNVWAVGSTLPHAGGGAHSLIQHWDGAQWTRVNSPNPGDPFTTAGALTSVSAVAPNDIWAVGFYQDKNNRHQFALLAHYDGQGWTAVKPPPLAGTIASLYRVFARAHDDVWAVGLRDDTGKASNTLIEHFDGKAWSVVPSANPPGVGPNVLTGITATAANDAWAVGYAGREHHLTNATLAEHWDGVSWRRVPTPRTKLPSNVLVGVAARSASDVWAVGYGGGGLNGPHIGDIRPLVEHWTGSKWVVVPAAHANVPGSDHNHERFSSNTIGSALNDVAVFPGATGATLVASGQYNTLVTTAQGERISRPHPYTITTTLP